jgi:two-component system KDP operon response regulator KdpE
VSGADRLVLLVEDDPSMSHLLRSVLLAEGYRVFAVTSAREAVRQASTRTPDLVVLDLGLPDADGLEVLRRVREWSRAPIVVVSARDGERDKVAALDAGADDYVTKPFAAEELLARLRVALRHSAATASGSEPVFENGDLRVDAARRQVRVRGAETRLTPTEWKLLAVLVRHAGAVVLQGQLLREVWGPGSESQSHYLRIYVSALRRKLERDPARPRHLLTEPGVGYRLRSDDAEG